MKTQSIKPKKEELARLCSGMNVAELAAYYGTYERLVYQWLDGYKLKPVPRPRGHRTRTDIDINVIVESIKGGMSTKQVAKKYEVCRETICKRLRDEGIKLADLIKEQDKEQNNNQKAAPGTTGYWCKYAGRGKHDCLYWDNGSGTCSYLIRTGNRRPCPADNCTVYRKRKAGECIGKWESHSIP
jgi:transposase